MNFRPIVFLSCLLVFGIQACGPTKTQTKTKPLASQTQVEPKSAMEAALSSGKMNVAKRIEFHTKLGKLWTEGDNPQDDKAKKHNADAIALWKSSHSAMEKPTKSRAANFTAQAIFQQAEHARKQFEGTNFFSPQVKVIQAQLKEKVKWQQVAANHYKDALRHCGQFAPNSPWAVASMVRLGQMLEHMGTSLSSAPVPSELNPEAKMQYKKYLGGMTAKFHEQAIRSYNSASNMKQDSPESNKWKGLALERICVMIPERCPKPTE